jgi:hypothetical protein
MSARPRPRRSTRPLAARAIVIGLGAAIAASAGCALVAGLDGERTMDASGAGGGATTTTKTTPRDGGAHADAAPTPDAGCVLATFPTPPDVSDAGGDVEVVAAIHTIEVGDQDTDVPLGYDLDAKCTCEGDGPSCRKPAGAKDACDGPGGRDAQSAEIFKLITKAAANQGGSDDFSSTANKGSWTMLVRIEGWNGLPDDDQVTVSLFPSDGLPGDARPPKWDGTDAWPVPQTAIVDGYQDVGHARFSDPHGYVKSSVFVGSLLESEILLAGKDIIIPVHLTAAFVTGQLTKKGGGWGITNGTVGARWKVSDIFDMVGHLELSGQPVCRDSFFYAGVKKNLCALPDITSALASPTAECDAISVGVLFQSDPAKLGAVVPPPTYTSKCKPGQSPEGDTCP